MEENSHNRYENVAIIGTGAYGTVYKARDLHNDGSFVAMKKINIQPTEDGVPMSTVREISFLKQIENFEHPNIVRLYDIIIARTLEQQKQLILVFEHVDQDLATYIERCPSPGLGPDIIKDLMRQLLLGVEFLHTNRIIHRDLKPSNILVTSDGHLKLADFGLSRVYGFQMALTSVVVTLWYRAPEVLLQGQYATPVDMWSCGCIFAEMFSRKPLFRGNSDLDQLYKIFEVIGLPDASQWPHDVSLPWSSFSSMVPDIKQLNPLENISEEMGSYALDLLKKFLKFDAGSRINATESLKHSYFDEDAFPMQLSNRVMGAQPCDKSRTSDKLTSSGSSAGSSSMSTGSSSCPSADSSSDFT